MTPARVKSIASVLMVFAACATSPGCGPDSGLSALSGPLSVTPPAAERIVGESVQFRAEQDGTTVAPTTVVRWSSSSPGVASVGENDGVARCQAPGSTTITARLEIRRYIPREGQALLTCRQPATPSTSPSTPPSTPPTSGLIDVSTGAVNFTHQIGGSPCPQSIGGFDIRNTTGQEVTVEVRSGNAAIQVSRSGGSVPAGGALGVEPAFNCATQQSFETDITITARAGSTTETKTVRVRATIQ